MATGSDIVSTARTALGTPYRWGGNSLSSGVDCSGLVQQVFKRNGINLPRVTYEQINVGHSVSRKNLRPGDLVFFDTDRRRSGPDHVGIYLGGGKFIHAARPGTPVKISSLGDSYYANRWMGGRRIQGVDASGGGGWQEPGAPAPRRLGREELAETYGMSVAFFNSVPELKKLLKEAVANQWTPDRFQASLKNTDWWTEHSKTSRQAEVLKESDPATYKAQLEAARVQAKQMAVQLGAMLPESKVQELAKNIVHFGWNEEMVANFLGKYVDFVAEGTLGGLAGAAQKEITRTAYDLGIRVTEQSILNNAQYIVRGVKTMEQVQQELVQQAAGLYPAFAEQIKAGASLTAIASPYMDAMAEEWGIPQGDISLFTPRIKEALNHTSSSGEAQPMELNGFIRALRQDPQWRKRPQVAEQVMGVGRQVLAGLGLGG